MQDALLHQLIYSLIVAGKSATFAKDAMARFAPQRAKDFYANLLAWSQAGSLREHLEIARTGNYSKLVKGIHALLLKLKQQTLDLATCGVTDLETVHGIGPKTARFFLLWTRPGQVQHAALDVHVLRWLRSLGYKAPGQTPSSSKKYAELEEAFLHEAAKRGLTPAQLDAQIWEAGRRAYLESRGQK
jgi:thermostable 8-oxoguanine DNA glycosylase